MRKGRGAAKGAGDEGPAAGDRRGAGAISQRIGAGRRAVKTLAVCLRPQQPSRSADTQTPRPGANTLRTPVPLGPAAPSGAPSAPPLQAGSVGAATVRPQPSALRCRSSSRAGRPRFWCFAPGKNPTDAYLDAMMNEAPGPINFTMFLTMFGEKLNGTDPEDVIRNAFACFDEEATGTIQEDYLRELLTTMGDRFTDEEVDELYREAPIDKKGNFNYIEFTRILKHGAKDKDD
uniref:Myosin light chain 12B n=1 Tax=Papio anubis TaxID=9555 RepID=A0A8I5NTE4_PAPAN